MDGNGHEFGHELLSNSEPTSHIFRLQTRTGTRINSSLFIWRKKVKI